MQQLGTRTFRRPSAPVLIGMGAVALGLVLREDPAARYALLLLGTWLVLAASISSALHDTPAREPIRRIPIRFSGGVGRFEVRPRGDGRRVEVRSGDAIVAELIARDEGDELVVDFGLADDPEVDAFGAAIGLAIEMVAAADEEVLPRAALEGPGRSWTSSQADRRGSLLASLRRT